MSAGLTASQALAFRAEINKLLLQLREEAADELQQARIGHRGAQAGAVHDRVDEAAAEAVPSVTLAHLSRHAEEIRQCSEAIHRIDSGDFGQCEECGEEIELNRLKADPLVSRCLGCQARWEFDRPA